MEPDRFGDLVADGVDRAERGHRLLKDHRDVLAPNIADLGPARAEGDQIDRLSDFRPIVLADPMKEDLPVHDPAGMIQNLQDRPRRDALAAAALAHDTERLAALHLKRDAVHGAHDAVLGGKLGIEPLNLEKKV